MNCFIICNCPNYILQSCFGIFAFTLSFHVHVGFPVFIFEWSSRCFRVKPVAQVGGACSCHVFNTDGCLLNLVQLGLSVDTQQHNTLQLCDYCTIV